MTEFIEFRGKMRTREAIAYIEAAERGEDPTATVPKPVDDTPKPPAPRTSTFPSAEKKPPQVSGGPLRPRNVTPDGKTVVLDKDSKPVGEPFEEKPARPPLVIPTVNREDAETFVAGRESEPEDPKPAPGQAGFEGEV